MTEKKSGLRLDKVIYVPPTGAHQIGIPIGDVASMPVDDSPLKLYKTEKGQTQFAPVKEDYSEYDLEDAYRKAREEESEKKKPTYPQDNVAINLAKTNEVQLFRKLIDEFTIAVIEEPLYKGTGRPGFTQREKIIAMAACCYNKSDLRKTNSYLKDLEAQHYISKAPSFKSISNFFNDKQLLDLLDRLILFTAIPFLTNETTVGIDATGFSISKYHEWVRYKFMRLMKKTNEKSLRGEEIKKRFLPMLIKKKKREFIKAHIFGMCGSNSILAVEVTKSKVSDSDTETLELLLGKVMRIGTMSAKDFVADKAYSTHPIYAILAKYDLNVYIPFKSNAKPTSKGVPLWQKKYWEWIYHPTTTYEHYHKRSNLESIMHMIKQKFGHWVASRNFTAMQNEVKTKVLCHNICVLIQEMYENDLQLNLQDCVETLKDCVKIPAD